MPETKRKAHASFPDLVGKEAMLTDTMISFLVGQKVEISGSIESGDFKITSLIHNIEFTKKIDRINEGASRISISDVKIMVDDANGRPLDLSCVEVLTIIDEETPDGEKIISHTFNVKGDKHEIRLYRVDESPEIDFKLSGNYL